MGFQPFPLIPSEAVHVLSISLFILLFRPRKLLPDTLLFSDVPSEGFTVGRFSDPNSIDPPMGGFAGISL
jgi:hypothetical protein